METKEFLEAIHGNKSINYRVINQGNSKNSNGNYDENMADKLKQSNTQGCDIYFVVNGGGTKRNEIDKINAAYIDYDAGKDENGKYFSLDKVKKYKDEQITFINNFKYMPSFIVETRNGLHAYWLLSEGATIQEFEECQLRLIGYFDSDNAIKTPERIMRLPGYYWMKYKDSPFMVNVISSNNVRYDIQDIIDTLPPSNIITCNRKASKIMSPVKQSSTNNNIDLIRSRDVEGLKKVVGASESLATDSILGVGEDINNINFSLHSPLNTPLFVPNRGELYHEICKIDLAKFLGLEDSKNFRCIFHNDNNPSANIFPDPETGHKIYKCFSSSCGFVGTIIKIVEKLQECRKSEAINFIKQVYNIELKETEWQKETKQMLHSNIEYLMSNLMKIEYPVLYQRIYYYIPELITLHEFAIMNLHDESMSGDGRHVFFATLKQMLKVLIKFDDEKLSQRLGLFAFLYLIEKLPDDRVPENMLKKSTHIASKKSSHHNTPNFFEIPSYDYAVLSGAESKAKQFKERNMVMTGFNRDMILRTYGAGEADRVFPKLNKNCCS